MDRYNSGRSTTPSSYRRFSNTASYTNLEDRDRNSSSNQGTIDNTAPDLRFRQLQGKV